MTRWSASLIVHGKTRGECPDAAAAGVDEMVVEGIETTLAAVSGRWSGTRIIDGTTISIGWSSIWPARRSPVECGLLLPSEISQIPRGNDFPEQAFFASPGEHSRGGRRFRPRLTNHW